MKSDEMSRSSGRGAYKFFQVDRETVEIRDLNFDSNFSIQLDQIYFVHWAFQLSFFSSFYSTSYTFNLHHC